jgi:large subunit ribosomal protein L22
VPGTKTNERPGTRAVLRHCRMSAYKARQVLDLIRGVEYQRATEVLELCDREAADVIGKVLRSAAANAEHNDNIASDDLYVSACYADEGATAKRWRPRARGRVTRIRKRTCHITVIVSRLPEDELRRRRVKAAAEQSDRRARRVAGARRSRRGAGAAESADAPSAEETASGAAADSTALPDESVDLADDGLPTAGEEEEEDVEGEVGASPEGSDTSHIKEEVEPDGADVEAEEPASGGGPEAVSENPASGTTPDGGTESGEKAEEDE